MSEISSFLVKNPKQITIYLSMLCKKSSMISAGFGANDQSYLTTVIGIDEKNHTLFLDYGSREDLNQQILSASKVTFETEYNGIKVSFVGSALKKVTLEGELAFSMHIPKSLFWMERREFYRVRTPFSKPSQCQLLLEHGRTINLKIYDISLIGFSMFNTSREISDLLVAGSTITDATLILANGFEERISFETRYRLVTKANRTQKVQKIGCKFISISRSVENAIQSYMQQIQREELQVEQQQALETITPYKKKIIIYTTH